MDQTKEELRKVNPKKTSNVFSKILFIYTLPLFYKGVKKDFKTEDIYEILPGYNAKPLGDYLEKKLERHKSVHQKISIFKLLWDAYGVVFLLYGFLFLSESCASAILQPYLLGKIISYFELDQTHTSKRDVYLYGTAFITYRLFQVTFRNNYFILITGYAIKVRTALCSLVYRKALSLNSSKLKNVSLGNLLNLITKDAHVIESYVIGGNNLWLSLIRTFLISALLYNKIGIAGFVGLVFLVFMVPLQLYLGKKVTSLRAHLCEMTDQRLQLTQETLSTIKIIKFYTWEQVFDGKITEQRKKEMSRLLKMFIVKFSIMVTGNLSSYIISYLTIATYLRLEDYLTPEMVYYMYVQIQDNLTTNLSIIFPAALHQTAEFASAVKRIQTIMEKLDVEGENIESNMVDVPTIVITNANVTLANKEILKEINLSISEGLTVITGNVGSGKTILLKTILQEYEPEIGDLTVQGTISYTSQEPWLFPSTIRQNILFGQKYNLDRYRRVLHVCSLIYDLKQLESGDSTVVEDRGGNLSRGQQARINLARAIYKDSQIYLLDDPLAGLDAQVGASIFKNCITDFLRDKIVIFVTHNESYAAKANTVFTLENGILKCVKKASELRTYEILNVDDDTDEENTLMAPIKSEKDSDKRKKKSGDATYVDEKSQLIAQKRIYAERKKTGKIDYRVYTNYIKFGGGGIVAFLVGLMFVVSQLVMQYNDKIMSDWINLEEQIIEISKNNITNETVKEEVVAQARTTFFIYTVAVIVTLFLLFGRAIPLILFTRNASIKLHKTMITKIINATMQFFDKNFIGNILNKFSKDLTIVDELIPISIYETFRLFLRLFGVFGLISFVNPLFLIPTLILLILVILLRSYCITTTRSLQRLNIATRSPVVGHLNATIEGLTTIRAFNAEPVLKNEFDQHQNLNTSAYYMFQCAVRSFSLFMGLSAALFEAAIVVKFMFFDSGTSAAYVGLALSQAVVITGVIQSALRQLTDTENQMTSIERALEYTEIKQENLQGLVLENWPKLGIIKYENVCLSYTNSNVNVLKNVNFSVNAEEKFGIVGRTGAGKSSIISTLFRLYDVQGKITIDNVDIKTLSLKFLRSKISIIPQDPVLFTGTIRENIDPERRYTDIEIWKALENANLKDTIANLDLDVTDAGSNFSVGQKQLICVARAIVQKNKIIVLDEATASIDPETEKLIYRTIYENFKSCTILIIAHKLASVLEVDKILVLDNGEVVEFDKPENLLKNKDGLFRKLIEEAGLLPD